MGSAHTRYLLLITYFINNIGCPSVFTLIAHSYGILRLSKSPKRSTSRSRSCLPKQRGNVSQTNLQVLNAILYVAEHGCKWRGLPKRFGNWHTIYTRMNRWSKNGMLDRIVRAVAACSDRAYQDRGGGSGQHHRQSASRWHWGAKKNGPQAIGKSRGGWSTKIHMVAADAFLIKRTYIIA